MKYREFRSWCEERAGDGYWGMDTAMFCLDVIRMIEDLPFWKREKMWQAIDDECSVKKRIVDPINQKIVDMYDR